MNKISYKSRIEKLLDKTLTIAENQLITENKLSISTIDTLHTLTSIMVNLDKKTKK
jgi:hypothetical protein